MVALPLGGIVVEQVHEVGDDPFHIAPLVEEHGHAPRSRSLHHRGRQLLQHHGLHGHRRHAALDERKQRLFGQIGVHAGETQRGEHEFALGEHLVATRERLVIEGAHARDLARGRPVAGSRQPNAVEGPHIHDIADGDHSLSLSSCRAERRKVRLRRKEPSGIAEGASSSHTALLEAENAAEVEPSEARSAAFSTRIR